MHVLEGSKEEIEKQLRTSLEAFFDRIRRSSIPRNETMKQFYWKLRERMYTAGTWPQGWVARGACYSLGLAVGLFVLEMLLKLVALRPATAWEVGSSF